MTEIRERVDEELVEVYRDGQLMKTKTFTSLRLAHIFIQNQIFMGYTCILKRLENGRAWATLKFCN